MAVALRHESFHHELGLNLSSLSLGIANYKDC